MNTDLLPELKNISKSLSIEGIISIEITEVLPVFKASNLVKNRIEELLNKQKISALDFQEEQELDCYEEIDDYLSFVNRTIRNLAFQQNQLL